MNQDDDKNDGRDGGEDGGGPPDAAATALPPREDAHALTVIGLGGSAGSIPALEAFFQGVGVPGAAEESADSAYVVVLHLSPEHESHLAEVLGRSSRLPVRQVTDTVKVEGGRVYVIPPGKHLEMVDGTLQLRNLEPGRGGTRAAIDRFFRTLAEAHGPQAAAVVLSGTGADGTLGIRRIKEAGGLAVAQSPGEAEYDAMPRSAVATGMIDYVLPVAAMPAQIASYWRTSRRMRLPEEAAPSPEQAEDGPEQEAALGEVLAHIRAQTGHDFSLYKRATILRRIGRRMQINGADALPLYRDFLRSHPSEVGDLVGDLLINVTQFFRDPDAWAALERDVIPRLFQDRRPQAGVPDELRAWVCGCATGEEAYSLAMLLLERRDEGERPLRIQIFATDMDADAIARARAGVYPDTIAADLSEERLRRWFHRHNGAYQVRQELRETILFAAHDVLRDTPFSRLDLVTCRNLLIYLNREAQERVFDTFHFALRPEGRLFLGLSETADGVEHRFGAIDKPHRLYARRPVALGGMPPPAPNPTLVPAAPLWSPGLPPGDFPAPARWVMGHDLPVGRDLPAGPMVPALPPPRRPVGGGRELLLSLLERYGPPTVLVDDAHDIVHLSNGAGRFLRLADGEPTRNLLQLIHPDLRVELRAALYTATTEGRDQFRLLRMDDAALVEGAAGAAPAALVRLIVRPVVDAPEGARGLFLVQFEPVAEAAPAEAAPVPPSSASTHFDLMNRLEEETAALQRQLRSTVEQYEAMTEELKASNEELQAMNEEQRSSAEELETSKEELQSVNEELSTVNHELKGRVDEVSRANSDLQNFLASTDIGTLFLDRELRIRRYTPAAIGLFNLIPSDIGRPLAHVTHRLDYPALTEDAETVLARLLPVEREVATTESDPNRRHFLARLLPYRSLDDRIDGVVVHFVDITERKRAEEALRASVQALRESEERHRIMVEGARDYAILTTDPQGRIGSWSPGAEAIFGWPVGEAIGHSVAMTFTPEDRAAGAPEQERATAARDGSCPDVRWHQRRDGARVFIEGIVRPLHDGDGALRGFLKVGQDVSERKHAEEALRRANEALEGTNATLEKRVAERTATLEQRTASLTAALAALKRSLDEQQRSDETRRELTRKVVSAQEDERRRISRELHDQMGQILTGFALRLRALEDALSAPEPVAPVANTAVPLVQDLRALADEMGREVHRIAVELRPTALDDLGLVPALAAYIEAWSQRTGTRAPFASIGLEGRRLPPLVETTLYRVVQEALTNAAKYACAPNVPEEARATSVSVTLQYRDDTVQATVEDDGPGFDPDEAAARGRLGLAGMRERAELAGGTLEIESGPGEGATVFVRLPLD